MLPALPAISGRDRLLSMTGEFTVHACDSCGAGCTAPALSDAEIARYYGQGYGSHVEASGGFLACAVDALKRIEIKLILRRLPFSAALAGESGHALDVGCGRGELGADLLARGWRVDGVEPSQRAAALARRRGINIVGESLATATLAADGYDLVVLRHSLEHLSDPLGDLERVRGALRAGARVVVSLPNFASWQRRIFGSRWFHLDLPRHRVHFTPPSLELACNSAGLTVRSRFTSTSVLGLPASLQYLIVGRCLAPAGLHLRAAGALCCVIFPLTWLIDRIGGECDTLHIVAGLR